LHDFQAVKEQIRQRIDLVELVSEHVALTRSGSRFRGLCPFHQEKTPSFYVHPDKMIFHCFGCKAGGDVFTFVQLREGISFGEAARMLADRAGVTWVSERKSGSRLLTRADLARVNGWAAKVFRRQLLDPTGGAATREYLARRGVSEATAEQFELGLAPGESSRLLKAAKLAGVAQELLLAAGLVRTGDRGDCYDTFRERLMFPIRDSTRRVVGFGGRTLADAQAKYVNTAQNDLFDKGRVLYGLDLARPKVVETGCAVVVEGYLDCIACHQYGFANAVATLGTAMTETHLELLRRHGHQVVLVFDSDTAGQAAAERVLGPALRCGLSVRLAFVPSGKDPADYLQTGGAVAFSGVLNSATDALGFVWERMRDRYASTTGDVGRRRAVGEFVELVANLSRFGAVDAIGQGLIANQVGKLLHLPVEQVHRLFGERGRRPQPETPRRGRPEVSEAGDGGSSAEQVALRTVLEVLLNRPGWSASAGEVFDPTQFEDPVLRKIATAVRDLLRRREDAEWADLLGLFNEPAETRRVVELQVRGEERGNFEATWSGALDCLRRVSAARRAADLATEVRRPGTEQGDGAEESAVESLAAIHRVSRDIRHFAQRSKWRAVRPH